jgi:hypothetical protein
MFTSACLDIKEITSDKIRKPLPLGGEQGLHDMALLFNYNDHNLQLDKYINYYLKLLNVLKY